MRTARLVGLSPDGASVIVATDSGEELAIPADESMRAALRGDRPRLGQLEIQMESSLSPRDIQTRIRGGATLEEVARVAGIPTDRVERFAAPVLAEREHIATQAMSATVRRKGETSGHRSLRITVTERLLARGIDIDALDWDSSRIEGGRWTVTCAYSSGEAAHQAAFVYDLGGRFSVAANDEARWLLGEHSSSRGPQPGRRRPSGSEPQPDTDDSEPTLDLSDELALVRATQEETELTPSRPAVSVVPALDASSDPDYDDRASEEMDQDVEAASALTDRGDETAGASEAALTDATAVPDTAASGGWEPAIVVDYPVEPSHLDDDHDAREVETEAEVVEAGSDEPGHPDPPTEATAREAEAIELELEFAQPVLKPTPGTTDQAQGSAIAAQGSEPSTPDNTEDSETQAPHEEAGESTVAVKRTAKKRASVPSWDEIMFGGPKKS